MIVLAGVHAASSSPSVPIEVSALAALIGIVWWLVRRADSADTARDSELTHTRRELADARRELADVARAHADEIADLNRDHQATLEVQSGIRHDLINKLAAARGGLSMVVMADERCTCGATAAVAKYAASVLNQPAAGDGL